MLLMLSGAPLRWPCHIKGLRQRATQAQTKAKRDSRPIQKPWRGVDSTDGRNTESHGKRSKVILETQCFDNYIQSKTFSTRRSVDQIIRAKGMESVDWLGWKAESTMLHRLFRTFVCFRTAWTSKSLCERTLCKREGWRNVVWTPSGRGPSAHGKVSYLHLRVQRRGNTEKATPRWFHDTFFVFATFLHIDSYSICEAAGKWWVSPERDWT